MSNNEIQNGTVDPTSKLEAIKDLIFGEQIAEYDGVFKSIKKDLNTKKEQLENLIEELRQELESSIDSLSTDINIRITDLETTVSNHVNTLESNKVDKKTLGKLLVSLGEKISEK
ncbi:MAG: fructose 1,6-bisphosphatase [Flavobacteriaceae bacterium]|nr:fructose 1,6-bisphosphatase [Flavobacteriaceae bacterium]